MPIAEARKGESKADIREWLKSRNKYMSGFCNDINKPAQHEGTKPSSGSKALPTCPDWEECPCRCHYDIDQMFKMTGMERQWMPNPEYLPDRGDFLMPIVEDPINGTAAFADGGPDAPPDDERAYTATSRPVAPPLAERRTETGRAARGGLEAQVWEACRALDADPMTPKQIGEYIAEKYKIPTPSSGAINAVWDRWEKMGFAKQGKKPNRFLGFTGEGTWEELARIKSSARTAKKTAASAARRGFR